MNNTQFRKLVLDTPARHAGAGDSSALEGSTSRHNGTPVALGSRMRSSIPMTPRSIAGGRGNNFARQLAERHVSDKPSKKHRSVAPRGVKLAAGYTDRAKARSTEEVADDKATRIKALEEMMKLQQIDQRTFEKLRDEIIGGDINSVHLVKGLDFKLLERVRRGEDVLAGSLGEGDVEKDEPISETHIDDELDALEDQEITPAAKENVSKKGEMAPPNLIPGKKRNRDLILAEMKAARLAAKEEAGPTLGSKFKKFGGPRTETRLERDSRGREVLITVDENGHEKRKVRKVQVKAASQKGHGLLMPDASIAPLGMIVPELPRLSETETGDIDIFDDVGDDYDPLAGLDDEDSEDDDDRAKKRDDRQETEESVNRHEARQEDGEIGTADIPLDEPSECGLAQHDRTPPSTAPTQPRSGTSRNYFGKFTEPGPDSSEPLKAMTDPTILAALKKASTLEPAVRDQSKEEREREEKRKRMLQADDRDAQDLDMGFGSSRFEDEVDLGDERGKLSAWGSGDGDMDDGNDKTKRKRGPKKRKGDVNSAADVLRVMEQKKNKGS